MHKCNQPANVVAFTAAGEEVTLVKRTYKVVRESDGAELTAASILELRKLYFSIAREGFKSGAGALHEPF